MESILIPNIYNYCDNWCERCKFTKRCGFYLKSHHLLSTNNEIDNDFWDEFLSMIKNESFIETYKPEITEIPFNILKDTKVFKEKLKREKAALHIITKQANKYLELVDAFLKNNTDKIDKLIQINGKNGSTNIENTIRCVDEIKWYQPQIYVKISRAIYSLQKEKENGDVDSYQNDSNGSAKVALLAIDNSVNAWKQIIASLDVNEDEILEALVFLEKLKKNILNYFPNAYEFIRPGFDE